MTTLRTFDKGHVKCCPTHLRTHTQTQCKITHFHLPVCPYISAFGRSLVQQHHVKEMIYIDICCGCNISVMLQFHYSIATHKHVIRLRQYVSWLGCTLINAGKCGQWYLFPKQSTNTMYYKQTLPLLQPINPSTKFIKCEVLLCYIILKHMCTINNICWPYGVIHTFITLLIYSLRNNWVTLTETFEVNCSFSSIHWHYVIVRELFWRRLNHVETVTKYYIHLSV